MFSIIIRIPPHRCFGFIVYLDRPGHIGHGVSQVEQRPHTGAVGKHLDEGAVVDELEHVAHQHEQH